MGVAMSANDAQPVSNRRFTVFEIVAATIVGLVLTLGGMLWADHTGDFADHEEDFDKHLLEFRQLNESVNALKTDMAVVRSQVDQNTRAVELNSQKLDQVLIELAKLNTKLADDGGKESAARPASI